MLPTLFAIFSGPVSGWSIGEIAIAIVAIAAIVALVCVALNKFGIQIPDWVKQVLWIVVVAVVVILAIRFIMNL